MCGVGFVAGESAPIPYGKISYGYSIIQDSTDDEESDNYPQTLHQQVISMDIFDEEILKFYILSMNA